MNIDTDLGSIAMRGNVGLQFIHANQSSSGYAIGFGNAAAPKLMSDGTNYNDVLPSMNLIFSLPREQTLRVALAEQMARPRMDDLRANHNYEVALAGNHPNEWVANGGNPTLKPWRATAFDISYEKYFGRRGYFALAGFHKDLHTWIQNVELPYDFTGYDPAGRTPISNMGWFTRPENRNGGILYGFEAALSVPFDLLWQPLDGFGLVASYSNTHSKVQPDGPNGAVEQLPGLSREVSNITLYYEKYGFSTRVSQRSRSPFLGEVYGFGGDRSQRYINSEKIVDFQLGYSFADTSALKGLSFLFQVNNVTNEPYREYFPNFDNLPQMFNEYGRTYLLGAMYKF